MDDHKLTLDTVAIIESLSPHEKKTGKMLYDHIQAQGREATYLPVETDAQFANAIQKLSAEAMKLRSKSIREHLIKMAVSDKELNNKLVQLYRETITSQQEPAFEKYRAEFFMHDAYPENMAEFCPTYED
ncbi:MAG: hypothetical protein DME22_11570 [Verrucomicrobia bacterium]|nr:MAG: hypothetical protein DME22_11570 [Verrucomicrobiota bacterium]PYK00353.1 MAG: hypothetical protein DME23_07520 [Verrucomicrobiota bacterium]